MTPARTFVETKTASRSCPPRCVWTRPSTQPPLRVRRTRDTPLRGYRARLLSSATLADAAAAVHITAVDAVHREPARRSRVGKGLRLRPADPSTGWPGSGLSHVVAVEPALFILTTAVGRR